MRGIDRGSQVWNTGNTRHAGSSDQVGHASPKFVYVTTSMNENRQFRLLIKHSTHVPKSSVVYIFISSHSDIELECANCTRALM